jgi:excisionase family DNA binding protein
LIDVNRLTDNNIKRSNRSLTLVDFMPLLSPRKAATALGVSESSLKRWCDRGEIPTVRTVGGHRQLETAAILEFARQTGRKIVRPELLEIGLRRQRKAQSLVDTEVAFLESLLSGDEAGCRFLARSCIASGVTVAEFADHYVAGAFREIGERWSHGEAEVYQERRACQVCQAVLEELSSLVPGPVANAPLAIGGAPEGDPYSLPTAIAALVLKQNAWQAQSLGNNLPWATLRAAIRDIRPQLFWLTVSTITDHSEFLSQYRQFFTDVGKQTAVVLGGRALTPELRAGMQFAAYCDNMQHLESVAATLVRVTRRTSNPAKTTITRTKRAKRR